MTSELVPAARATRHVAGRPEAVPTATGLRRVEQLFPVAFHLAVPAALLAAGQPTWRVAVVALGAALPSAQRWAWSRYGPGPCVRADAMQCARGAVAAQAGVFGGTWLTAAVTGGIHSPLLPDFAGGAAHR